MLEVMVLGTNKIKIYIPLLDEGIKVSRPTLAEEVGQGRYKVLPTDDYDPEDEVWEFPPGSIVTCISEVKDGETILTADSKV
jgi:hypothetical protein